MESFNRQKWEDLNLSRDEINSFGEALKKEEFRNLLKEYVKEIQDPENRKQYEEEITQLENERGVDVTFVHPTPGYVVKTSVEGKSKAFINVCSNNNVGKPSATPDVEEGRQGLHWSLPYCLAPARDDLDKRNNVCVVYDVVFHPDTLQLAKNNDSLKRLVDDTALEAIEENFKVSLDKINLKYPKMQYKGMKFATVIRKKIENFQPKEVFDIPNYPYQPIKEKTLTDSGSPKKTQNAQCKEDKNSKYTTPKHTVTHRSAVDMQDFTNDPMSKLTSTVPNELVITIDLPLLKCASDASIDVLPNALYLISERPAKYKLNLKLPFHVDSNRGSAKFDSFKRMLTVTLPVLKKEMSTAVDFAREDSGVESDNYVRTNSVSSSDEDEMGEKCLTENNSNIEVSSKDLICSLAVEKLLKPDLHYILPHFLPHFSQNTLTLTLFVPNVNPDSVEYCFLQNTSGYHLTFHSTGTGFFPVNYALFLCFQPPHHIENETFCVEVWDNNVIAQVKLTQADANLTEYYVGSDESNIKKYLLPVSESENCIGTDKAKSEKDDIVKTLNTTSSKSTNEKYNWEGTSENKDVQIQINSNEVFNYKRESLSSSNFQVREQNENQTSSTTLQQQNSVNMLLLEDLFISESASSHDESSSSPQHQPAKCRTLSESHQGENMRIKSRGILKIGRSLSESSVDDYASWSAEKMEKTKKTVRFSETISKQVFRMNSSILGQRKKNQRKMRNKKRAQERRLSESGNESEGEGESTDLAGKSLKEKNYDVWFKETESSSCEVSEVSDVTSESDDGQKDVGRAPLPCSNRKNHKRRGKKSARKNAATAKFMFMEN